MRTEIKTPLVRDSLEGDLRFSGALNSESRVLSKEAIRSMCDLQTVPSAIAIPSMNATAMVAANKMAKLAEWLVGE